MIDLTDSILYSSVWYTMNIVLIHIVLFIFWGDFFKVILYLKYSFGILLPLAIIPPVLLYNLEKSQINSVQDIKLSYAQKTFFRIGSGLTIAITIILGYLVHFFSTKSSINNLLLLLFFIRLPIIVTMVLTVILSKKNLSVCTGKHFKESVIIGILWFAIYIIMVPLFYFIVANYQVSMITTLFIGPGLTIPFITIGIGMIIDRKVKVHS